METVDEPVPRARQVAIIGAGPSGLAAARYLLAERSIFDIIIYEQRSECGGLWVHTPCPTSALEELQVPQTNAHQGQEKSLSVSKNQTTFLSPVYDELETNIPRGLMGFSDLDWPKDCQLFPTHQSVLKYVQDYSRDVHCSIEYQSQVIDIIPRPDHSWTVQWKRTDLDEPTGTYSRDYDAVIVANGHFRVEYIPEIEGMKEWHQQYPDSIYHSKLFRRAEDFAGKNVIVVGNSASGIDIGAQIKSVCKKPLIVSSRSQSYLQLDPPPDQKEKPEIRKLIPEGRRVVFVDGSEENDVDVIVFCTGYMYNFPFLEKVTPALVSTGERVQHLYKHLFYYPAPTLSFLVLNQKVIPFPTAEAQAAVVARYLSGRLDLPSYAEMKKWEEDQLAQTDRLRDFHVLKFPKDGEYINEMHDWSLRVDAVSGKLDEYGQRTCMSVGKMPPRWGELEFWTRERFPDIRRAFKAQGEARASITTLKEIGFDFDAWIAEQVKATNSNDVSSLSRDDWIVVDPDVEEPETAGS